MGYMEEIARAPLAFSQLGGAETPLLAVVDVGAGVLLELMRC